MKFSNGANMRRHKQRHTGVKPYECRVCQKRFFRKDHLAEHFTTHTKTLPYHCPICNRGFQRQIAMRAHFQNEHVGQHDLVKTCPLCSYRAGTMKSLRVHFFNRHGIDLDNPGSGTPSSLLLALEQSNSAHLLPALAAAANASANAFSDSGDSARSTDNATPPMHFLTPHVEISMADNMERDNPMRMTTSNGTNSSNEHANTQTTSVTATTSSGLDIQAIVRPLNTNGASPVSPQSADSNSNVPSSSHSSNLTNEVHSSRHGMYENAIKPSISLIPIKQVIIRKVDESNSTNYS
jgi:IKAROS family zinc finger protein